MTAQVELQTLEDLAGAARDVGNALDAVELPELAELAERIADELDRKCEPAPGPGDGFTEPYDEGR